MYSGPVTIYQRDGWTLDSYGNGAAYTLRAENPMGGTVSCFFQGEDATAFRTDFDSAFEHDRISDLFGQYWEVMSQD